MKTKPKLKSRVTRACTNHAEIMRLLNPGRVYDCFMSIPAEEACIKAMAKRMEANAAKQQAQDEDICDMSL